jgi:hypothetical protein
MIIDSYIKNRFEIKIVKKHNKCWEFSGSKNKDGYCKIKYKEKYYWAHRFSWMLYIGDIPDKIMVCHHCDNPSCVNPEHLFLGTQFDNMKDMIKKGRHCKKFTVERRKKISLSLTGRKLSKKHKYNLCKSKKYGENL